MGHASRAKAMRRSQHQHEARKPVLDIEIDTDDDELNKLARKDVKAQQARLTASGWQLTKPNGHGLGSWANRRRGVAFTHEVGRLPDGVAWARIVISRADGHYPDIHAINVVQWTVYPESPGYITIPPLTQNVDITEVWTSLSPNGAPPKIPASKGHR